MRAEGRSLAKPFLQALKTRDPFQRTATYLAGMSLCKERGTEQLRLGRRLCRKAQGESSSWWQRGTQVGVRGGVVRKEWKKVRASSRDGRKTTLPLPSFLLYSRPAQRIP